MRQEAKKSSRKFKYLFIIVFFLLIAIAILAYQKIFTANYSNPEPNLVTPELAPPSTKLHLADQVEQNDSMSEVDIMVAELSERLRRQFADNIHLIAIQVSLKSLRDDLSQSYPEQGHELFVRIVKKAFPEWLSAILNAIALMDKYDDWLQSMLLNLNDMNVLEQQGVLWDKRRELFGDAATQIWQEEISAEQERQATMNRTMEILDGSYDTQMQERLYIWQSSFEDSYSDKLQNMLVDPTGVLVQVFFGFDAVQKDLSALPPEERQAQINDIRKTMGFSDEQIKAQAESDQKREKRWQNGYAYMEARKAIEAQYTGDKLAQEMDALREKFFAHEANTIKKEEEELDFYRYKRPRVYGRN